MTTPTTLYRARRYSLHGYWRTWYEPCPVIAVTSMFITVSSESYPESPLYRGGDFRLSRHAIEKHGQAYHSRHGEYFFTEPQSDAFLFPSKDVLESEDFVTIEARNLGWWGDPPAWNSWQRLCFMYATLLKTPLRQVVDRWRFGGDSAFEEMAAEFQEKNRLKTEQFTEEQP